MTAFMFTTDKENNMANHILPSDVNSPKKHWMLSKVLYDDGPSGISIAVGYWDGEAKIAIRWNGNKDHRIGNPQSSGHPTWFILPSGPYGESVIAALPKDMQTLARNFLITEKK